MAELREIRVSQLKANPFRDIENYPFDKEKLERLKDSIRQTGAWPNIVVRESGTSGEYELAYGHHRIEALKQLEVKKVTVVVEDLTNDQMLQMMANENSEEYGHDFALGVMNAVEALVRGYAAGTIQLSRPDPKTKANWREAPSFSIGSCTTESTRPYTASEIARYLGWGKSDPNAAGGVRASDRVHTALAALELIERKVLTRAQLRGLRAAQARDLITLCKRREEAERARLEAEADRLKQEAAKAQKADDKTTLRRVEHKLEELHAEVPKAIAKAGKEAISVVKEFYDPKVGMAEALRKAADQLKIETPKPKVKLPKVVDLSSVEHLAARLDGLLAFDDPSWVKILKLAAESKATKPFSNLETSLLRLTQRIGERVKELKKARS